MQGGMTGEADLNALAQPQTRNSHSIQCAASFPGKRPHAHVFATGHTHPNGADAWAPIFELKGEAVEQH